MNEVLEFPLRAIAIGVGATIILDLWSLLLRRFGVTTTNWGMVGRWLGHFRAGRFTHDNMAAAAPVRGEHVIGWTAHYVIGVLYASALLVIVGLGWAHQPTLLPALIFGWATIVAPMFIMQPGMGAGVAASKTPNPNVARLKTLLAHSVFGLGLYVAAVLTSLLA
ncbi:MAG: DUF2938 domain-containing protein [Caulobacteraceae bacterium]